MVFFLYLQEKKVKEFIIIKRTTTKLLYTGFGTQTAKQFGVSKSTVHKDVTQRLLQINPVLAKEARVILDINKSERHIRGGMATREKYRHKKN